MRVKACQLSFLKCARLLLKQPSRSCTSKTSDLPSRVDRVYVSPPPRDACVCVSLRFATLDWHVSWTPTPKRWPNMSWRVGIEHRRWCALEELMTNQVHARALCGWLMWIFCSVAHTFSCALRSSDRESLIIADIARSFLFTCTHRVDS